MLRELWNRILDTITNRVFFRLFGADGQGYIGARAVGSEPDYGGGNIMNVLRAIENALITGPVPITGSSSGSSSAPDGTTFTEGTSNVGTVGAEATTGIPTAATTGKLTVFAATLRRALHINLRDSSGNELLGQKVMAASVPVVLASDESSLPITAAALPLPAGAATETTLAALNTKVTAVNTGAVVISGALPAGSAVIGHVIADSGSTTAVTSLPAIPAGTNVIGHVIVDTAPTTAVTLATAPALVASSAIIGKVGIDQTTPGTTDSVTAKNAYTDTTLLNAVNTTGASAWLDVTGMTSVGLQVTITNTATVQFEYNIDGSTVNTIQFTNLSTLAAASTATATGAFGRRVAGFKQIRVNVTSYTSGTVTVTAHAIAAGDLGQMPVALYGKSTNAGDTALVMADIGGTQAAQIVSHLGANNPPDNLTSNIYTPKGLNGNIGYTPSLLMDWNGASWDRQRANTDLTLLASAARTATTASADNTNFNGRGVVVVLNVSAASGTGGLSVQIQGKDSISGTYYQINAAPTAVTATGLTTYVIYPGATGGQYTQQAGTVLPRTWRVNVSHGDASSYTYSVSAITIL